MYKHILQNKYIFDASALCINCFIDETYIMMNTRLINLLFLRMRFKWRRLRGIAGGTINFADKIGPDVFVFILFTPWRLA